MRFFSSERSKKKEREKYERCVCVPSHDCAPLSHFRLHRNVDWKLSRECWLDGDEARLLLPISYSCWIEIVHREGKNGCVNVDIIFFFLINLTFYSTSTTKFGYLFIPRRTCTYNALNSRWNSFPTILSIKTERDNRRNCSEIVPLYEKIRESGGIFPCPERWPSDTEEF